MPRAQRAVAALALAGLAALAAASCDSGGSNPMPKASRSGRTPSASASRSRPELPAESRFGVPSGFDNTHGWTEAVSEPDSRTHGSWVVAPRAGVLVQSMNNEGKVHARKLDGGKELWTFTTPTALEHAQTDLYVTSGSDGSEIVVVVRQGTAKGGSMEKSSDMVTVDTVHATATGKADAIRHFQYPGAEAGDFAGGLLITEEGELTKSTLLDPATGKEKKITAAGTVRLSRCRTEDMPPSASCSAQSTARYATAQGPLSVFQQSTYCDYKWKAGDYLPCADGFAVGGWNSEQVAPGKAGSATPLAVVGDYVVVDWSDFPDTTSQEDSKKDVVAVHDLSDGKLVAQADCDITDSDTGTGAVEPLSAQATTELSPDGDYLVSGQVGFDLAAKRGSCFTGTAKTKGATLTAVDDTGRGYGVTYDASRWADLGYGAFPYDFGSDEQAVPARAVQANVRSGAASALPKKDAVPVFVSKDVGLFLTGGTLAAYPAKGGG